MVVVVVVMVVVVVKVTLKQIKSYSSSFTKAASNYKGKILTV